MSRSLARHPFVPLLFKLLLLFGLGYAGLCGILYFLQHRLLFFQGGPPARTPADLGLAFTDVRLTPEPDLNIHAWWIPLDGARGTVLIAHGNAGNIEHRLPLAETFRAFGFSVLLFDYRGYGHSEGEPSEQGLYRDAQAAYDFVVGEQGVDPAHVVLYGESLGGAVVLELAAHNACGAILVESTFTRLPDLAAGLYPWLPVRLLSRYSFANVDKVHRLRAPLFVLHSPDDEIVPFRHAEELRAAAPPSTRLLATEGGHNDGGFRLRPDWRAEVHDFLEQSIERPR